MAAVRRGFVLDQRTCIGCHACTVACKTEFDIPLGQFRTWVKYVETGSFPDTTREFGVLRCNHCTDAPCVTICPTGALWKRDDGIVDFDGDRCIGCKSCQQGCPYDAIYINAETSTAAKCNLCAHRVDSGLEPACVVVCPTHSIWVGDLDDPTSGVARLVQEHPTKVRSPEQGTGPNVFYLGADRAVLDPLAAPVQGTYLWAHPDEHRLEIAQDAPAADGARTTLNTAHPPPWGAKVSTYLWTKSVAAGAVGVVAVAELAGADLGPLGAVGAPLLGLAGAAATGALLLWDLKRPERFLYIFTKSNSRSWLVRGSYALLAFGGATTLQLAAGGGGLPGVRTVADVLAVPTAGLAAGYTAFLFGQAEGRDLWQSPWLLPDLLAQAVAAGSGALLAVSPLLPAAPGARRMLTGALVGGIAAHLGCLLGEYGREHPTANAAVAARTVVRGRHARRFWLGAVGLAAAAAATAVVSPPLAGLLVQPALIAYESVFVRAGQDPPLS